MLRQKYINRQWQMLAPGIVLGSAPRVDPQQSHSRRAFVPTRFHIDREFCGSFFHAPTNRTSSNRVAQRCLADPADSVYESFGCVSPTSAAVL
jgi:hypothetical protein